MHVFDVKWRVKLVLLLKNIVNIECQQIWFSTVALQCVVFSLDNVTNKMV